MFQELINFVACSIIIMSILNSYKMIEESLALTFQCGSLTAAQAHNMMDSDRQSTDRGSVDASMRRARLGPRVALVLHIYF